MELRFGDYRIDTRRLELFDRNGRVRIEPQALELLVYLIRNRDRLVTREELHQAFWNGRFVSDSALSTLVKSARRAIGDSGREGRTIETMHGRGFRFRAAVTEYAEAATPPTDVLPANDAPPAPAMAASAVLRGDGPAIAVAPFENRSGEDRDRIFAGAITDELRTGLAQLPDFTVISSETMRRVHGLSRDRASLGELLGIDYLVTGSATRADRRMRVHVELVEVATGFSLLARRLDVTFETLFEALDEVSGQILAAIEPAVVARELHRAPARPSDESVWLLHIRAKQLLAAPSQVDLADAVRLLERAAKLDPNSPAVTAGLALARLWQLIYGPTGGSYGLPADRHARLLEAHDLAMRAVVLGGGGWAWSTLGDCKLQLRDHDGALAAHREALLASPSSALSHGLAALAFAFAGEMDDALAIASRAQRLSPVDPRAAVWWNAEGLAHFLTGRFDRSMEAADRVAALRPDYPGGWRLAAASAARLGAMDHAREAVRRLVALLPGTTAEAARTALPFRFPHHADAYAAALVAAGVPRGDFPPGGDGP